jgi:hypothetical protein
MIYYHNKLKEKENISLKDFIKVVEFLDNEGVISNRFFNHHTYYEFYKEQLTFCDEYQAKQNTMTKFNIGKGTFHTIKKKFKSFWTK